MMNFSANHPGSPTTPPAASRTLLLATDLQQSILAELDRTGPNRLAYSAYGVPSSQRPPGASLGFNGQLRERPTGWYHLGNGHRVYNPVLMRFHSPDRLSPFGKGGINAYAYCGGSPVGRVDPSGQSASAIVGTVIGETLSPIFALGAFGRTLTAITNGQTLSPVIRAANTFSFWGGVGGAVFRPLSVPSAFAAATSDVLQSISSWGNSVSQSSTFLGGVLSSASQVQTALAKLQETGQVTEVVVKSLKEVAGYNQLFGVPFPKLKVNEVQMAELTEVAIAVRNNDASPVQEATLRRRRHDIW